MAQSEKIDLFSAPEVDHSFRADSAYLPYLEFARQAMLVLQPGFPPGREKQDEKRESEDYNFDRIILRFGNARQGYLVTLQVDEIEARIVTFRSETVTVEPYGQDPGIGLTIKMNRPPNHSWHECTLECSVSSPEKGQEETIRLLFLSVFTRENSGEKIADLAGGLQSKLSRGQFDSAGRAGEAIVKKDPGNVDALFAVAIKASLAKDYPRARELFEKVVSLKPDHYDAFYNLGLVFFRTNLFDKAIEAFTSGLKIDPDNHPLHYELGCAFEAAGRRDEALLQYQEAVRLSPNPGGAWGYSGMDYTNIAADAIRRLGGEVKDENYHDWRDDWIEQISEEAGVKGRAIVPPEPGEKAGRKREEEKTGLNRPETDSPERTAVENVPTPEPQTVQTPIHPQRPSFPDLLDKASRGVDISSDFPGLVSRILRLTQLPDIRPAMEAAVLHALARKNLSLLQPLLGNKDIVEWVLAAFRDLAEKGRDISNAYRLLSDYYRVSKYTVQYSLLYAVEKGKNPAGTLTAVFGELKSNPRARPFIADFFREVLWKGIDLTPYLDELSGLLEDRDLVSGILSLFRCIVERDVDIAAQRGKFARLLDHPEGSARRSAAYVLVRSDLLNGRRDEIAALLKNRDQEILEGAVYALAVFLNGDNPDQKVARTVAAFLTGMMSDKSSEIRELAANALSKAEKKGRVFPPETDDLQSVVRRLEKAGTDSPLSAYLYRFAAAGIAQSAMLKDVLSETGDGAGDAVKSLLKTCDEILGHRHFPSCGLCRNIPHSGEYSSERDVPAEVGGLKEAGPPGDAAGKTLKVCPECGIHYLYSFEQEWDDMSLDTTITIERLTPDLTMVYLRGEEREKYERRMPAIVRELENCLDHPEAYLREYAARTFAGRYVSAEKWDRIAGLLTHRDQTVRMAVLDTLRETDPDKRALEPLIPFLEGYLGNELNPAREKTSSLLCELWIKQAKREDIGKLLRSENEGVNSGALTALHRYFANADGSDRVRVEADMFFPIIRNLTKSRNEAVRQRANWVLASIRKWTKNPEAGLDHFIEAVLSGNNAERQDAFTSLSSLVEERMDISRAFPAISKYLDDPDAGWGANEVLKKAAQWHQDISPAVPSLIRALAKPDCRIKSGILWTLDLAMNNGNDVTGIIPLLPALQDLDTYFFPYLPEHFPDADYSPVLPLLKKNAESGDENTREIAAKSLELISRHAHRKKPKSRNPE